MGEMLVGTSLIVIGSILNGLWAYPMKLVKEWRWENIWFLFGLWGLVIFPWLTAWITVPQLFDVYSGASPSSIMRAAALGFAWGVGSLFFGLGISALGLSLGYALIVGTTAVLGTVVPALVLNPDLLFTARGAMLLAGLVVIVTGLAAFAVAGRRRDASTAGKTDSKGFQILSNTQFLRGLAICFLGGTLSACFNVGFALTQDIMKRAVQLGASRSSATNAVWAIVMSAGFIPSAVYCFLLFKKHKSFAQFRAGRINWLYAFLMGLLWMGSVILYGAGAVSIGAAGATLGWPILMAGTVVVANLSGLATGEWSKTDQVTMRYLFLGISLLVVAVILIGSAGA